MRENIVFFFFFCLITDVRKEIDRNREEEGERKKTYHTFNKLEIDSHSHSKFFHDGTKTT